MEQDAKNNNLRTTIAVLLVIVIIVGGVIALTNRKSDDPESSSTPSTTQSENTPETSTETPSQPAASSFKDGNYSASGSYTSPGGRESITIKVTLKDDVVTDTSATSKPSDSTAEDFQNEFIAGYKKLVVGKNIDDIRLSQVSGSSLTSQGFNAAIDQIKNQAKS